MTRRKGVTNKFNIYIYTEEITNVYCRLTKLEYVQGVGGMIIPNRIIYNNI